MATLSGKKLDNLLEKESDDTKDEEIIKLWKASVLLLMFLSDRILASLQKEDTACKI